MKSGAGDDPFAEDPPEADDSPADHDDTDRGADPAPITLKANY